MLEIPHSAHILIVDDEHSSILLLQRMLATAGYAHLESTTDPRRVLPLYRSFRPDLILLDLRMPYLDGFAVLESLATLTPADTYLPIVVMTADARREARLQALARGAMDFLPKPLDRTEVLLRIRNLLQTRYLHLELQRQNGLLEAKVRERTRDLERAQAEILQRLASAAEFRDDALERHTQRVSQLTLAIGRVLGLPDDTLQVLARAAALHDIGKLGIPDSLLLTPRRLTAPEYEQVKAHTTIGAAILDGSEQPILRLAALIALTHHEHWDGSGYPRGLAGAEIPLAGRIVAVADVFDALVNPRPYKPPWPAAAALAELVAQKGILFDPQVVDALLRVVGPDGCDVGHVLRDGGALP